jgi:hypothetical protein
MQVNAIFDRKGFLGSYSTLPSFRIRKDSLSRRYAEQITIKIPRPAGKTLGAWGIPTLASGRFKLSQLTTSPIIKETVP